MELQTLARPYAKAVFEIANAEQQLAAWGECLSVLAATVADARVAALIAAPALTREQLGETLAGIVAAAGLGEQAAWPRMQSLVHLLAENRRLPLAGAIAGLYEVLRGQAESRVDVQVTSAVAVAAPQAEALQAAIGKRLGRSVEVSWQVDAELLGGAVVRAGDLVVDGSLKGELERLSQVLGR